MAQGFQVRFTGGRELVAALTALGSLRRVTGAMTRAGKRALQPIADEAERRAPRSPESTGQLAAGVTVVRLTRRQGAQADAVTLAVGVTGPHRQLAHLFEFGFTQRDGRQYPARPFLRPAWDGGKARALSAFRGELWAFIKRAARRAKMR